MCVHVCTYTHAAMYAHTQAEPTCTNAACTLTQTPHMPEVKKETRQLRSHRPCPSHGFNPITSLARPQNGQWAAHSSPGPGW